MCLALVMMLGVWVSPRIISSCMTTLQSNRSLPRHFQEMVNQEIEKQCTELELLDIIEPSTSPWCLFVRRTVP